MKPANYAPVYTAGVYPEWAEIARKHGYALAVHGSCARDLDVVFVPWSETVSPPAQVVAELQDSFAVHLVGEFTPHHHGRYVQTMAWMKEYFVDASFIGLSAEHFVGREGAPE